MFPTNRTLTISRKGVTIASVEAHVEPATAELKAMLGVPASLLFHVYILDLPDVQLQDRLVSMSPAEAYQVTGIERFDVDLVRHTHLTAEIMEGTQ